eukprot:6024210-Heterocapsa_arctica.AAC.1
MHSPARSRPIGGECARSACPRSVPISRLRSPRLRHRASCLQGLGGAIERVLRSRRAQSPF